MRIQLRAALDEMESNDKIIESQKCHQNDLTQQMKLIESHLSTLREELEQNEEALEGVVEHNKNL
jgi:predicted  nucleic acid-binding Zn-ribbon protein